MLDPSSTDPEPSKLLMAASVLAPLISNAPFAITFADSAIAPSPLRARMPASIVVLPL